MKTLYFPSFWPQTAPLEAKNVFFVEWVYTKPKDTCPTQPENEEATDKLPIIPFSFR